MMILLSVMRNRVLLILFFLASFFFAGRNTPVFAFGNSSIYPAGWYSFLYTTSILPQLKTKQVNTVLAWPANSSVSTVKSYLDAAQANGIQVILSVVQMSDSEIQGLSSIANHAALAGWYIADEPEEAAYNSNAYNIVHQISAKPALIVHYDTGAFDRFTTDIQGLDYYPQSASMLYQSPSYWKQGVEWAKSHNKEFIAVPLGFGATETGGQQWNLGDYTEDQYRFHIMSAVALGADGIALWHTDPQDESLYNTNSRIQPIFDRVIQSINAVGPEMAATAPSVSGNTNRGVNDSRITITGATSSQLVYRYGATSSRQAILAVNLSSSSLNVTFKVSGATTGTVNVVMESGGTSRSLSMSNGSFSDSFSPYAVHAYVIGGSIVNPTPIPTSTPQPNVTPTSTPKPNPSPTPSNPVSVFEAEASINTLSGTSRILSCLPCSGDNRVGYIGGSPSNTLAFNKIILPSSGTKSVLIKYTNGLSQDLSAWFQVNNGPRETFVFPSTSGFDAIGDKAITLDFASGTNTITIGNDSADAPDIDAISVESAYLAPFPGDANLDGKVDDLDYIIWANNYGKSNTEWATGDFNDDLVTNDLDYVIWAKYYQP